MTASIGSDPPVRANRELFAVARYSILQHCPLSLFDTLSLKSLTTLGNTAVACAAVDDVTAWRLLAVVIATVKASGFGGAILTILLTLVFICLMLFVLKRQANRVINAYLEAEIQRRGLIAIILIFGLASAPLTEVIGIHALFALSPSVCSLLKQADINKMKEFDGVDDAKIFAAEHKNNFDRVLLMKEDSKGQKRVVRYVDGL